MASRSLGRRYLGRRLRADSRPSRPRPGTGGFDPHRIFVIEPVFYPTNIWPIITDPAHVGSIGAVALEEEQAVANYIVAHWRGQFGLLRSCFVNGVGGYLLLVVASGILGGAVAEGPALSHRVLQALSLYGGLLAFIVWSIWALVGIFRCGARNAFDRTNATARRVGGAAAIAGALLAALTMLDLLVAALF
jgi:hypothetical protein